MNDLKLNTKKTFLLGLAFFTTLMVWQVYNNYCPIILQFLLQDTFQDNPNQLLYVVGIIMASDNIVALIIMPLFGYFSDRTKTKFGKRMPYILIGMLLTAIIFPLIAVMFILNSLVGVIIAMGIILVIMQGYRNPLVSLMPDITPKPLRSTANGIINLVGYVGAVIAAGMGIIWGVAKNKDAAGQGSLVVAADELAKAQDIMLYPFIITAVFTIAILIILFARLNEPKLLAEAQTELDAGEQKAEVFDSVATGKLSKKDHRNLILLIASVFLWYMAFNAIETFSSLFAVNVLGDSGIASTMVIVMTFSSIGTFWFARNWANKWGRKKVVLIGLAGLIIGIGLIALFTFVGSKTLLTIIMYGASAILGFGWALININSYPMVVELANQNNVGKYTTYYYIGSMLAQSITPILVGLIMSLKEVGIQYLFVYAVALAIAALAVFIFIQSKKLQETPIEKSGNFFETISD
jgi:MFS family permease